VTFVGITMSGTEICARECYLLIGKSEREIEEKKDVCFHTLFHKK